MKQPRAAPPPWPVWLGPALFLLVAAVMILLGLLAFSIMERRWEMLRPAIAVVPIAEWEPDNAVWGRNYPRQYEAYLRTRDDTTRTRYGGGYPRDYLEIYPHLTVLYAGYGFSEEYLQGRGHFYSAEDVVATRRRAPATPSTCWTCKTSEAPALMAEMGVAEFYRTPFDRFVGRIRHPIGCQDCHDPDTMNLRITRPALREAFEAMGRDIDRATHQEMRSLVCAQCHSEYYFGNEDYLVFPWARGLGVEEVLEYFDGIGFSDWIHPVSGAPMLKVQHPDYEIYTKGIHAYRNVSCADCHMPYRVEGGVKITDHHVQSPLLNIANSCGVCHRWGEQEIRTRVESIQETVERAKIAAEEALVRAHIDLRAAWQAGASDEELDPLRHKVRHAQFRWDFVASNNGLGFHAPQECLRILGDSRDLAQQARVEAARLLAARGDSEAPRYPDLRSRETVSAFLEDLLSGRPAPARPGPAQHPE